MLTDDDRQHLRLLSIFYYVAAGLSLLGILFGLIYVLAGIGVGVFFWMSPPPPQQPSAQFATQIFSLVFSVVGVAIMLMSALFGILHFHTARQLAQFRSWTFCFVMAIITCLSVPLGTILGVFTLIVINRPQVKAEFIANNTSHAESSWEDDHSSETPH